MKCGANFKLNKRELTERSFS